jgi:hypothetical protein
VRRERRNGSSGLFAAILELRDDLQGHAGDSSHAMFLGGVEERANGRFLRVQSGLPMLTQIGFVLIFNAGFPLKQVTGLFFG